MAKLDLGKVVPIKGEDYFTNSEIEEIKNDIEQEIEIPTKTSDLTNDSGFINKDVNNLTNYTLGVETGSSIDLSLDSSTYVMTLSLKNSDGTVLNTKTVDLPLESVVVDGDYDSTNKKIILTLESGSTIDVPVGDLINGLQSEITSNNKLSSDLVDDTNNTNKFVTSAEKTTWNGKQDELTFDSTPTENSNNPVTSDGIFQALAGAGGGGSVGTVVNPVPTKFVIKNYDVGIYYFFDQPSYFDVAYNPQNVYQTIRISGRPHMAVIFKKISDISELEVGEVFAYVLYSSSNNINFKVFARGSYDTSSYTAFDFGSYNFASTKSNNFTGTNTFNSYLPTSTLTPTQSTELVPKSYVDAQIQALRDELSGE